ncbi:MAG: ABC transporter permease [Chloroflexi bacterium]|nr:ABC transporter permease [Chloroflexota bacterium]
MRSASLLRSTAANDSALELGERAPRTFWGDAWRQFRRQRTATIGLCVLAVLILGTLAGPFVYSQDASSINFGLKRQGPTLAHPFGTNDVGQDQMARAMVGGRISLAVGLTAAVVSIVLGLLIGTTAGYFGGHLDNLLMRLTDLFLSLPFMPVLLMTLYLFRDALRGVFGPQLGIFLLIVGLIGGFQWMSTARIVRASVLSLKETEFVEAARCVGVQTHRIILRHILPNVLSPVIVAATLGVGAAIIAESTLSFLGLGFPPDFPTWGRMLFDAQDYLELSPHMALFPGLLISLTVLSINYVGDGLRDALDPRRTT